MAAPGRGAGEGASPNPADGNQKEVTATLDAARALIAEADAAERAPSTAQAESIARDWWAHRQVTAPRKPISTMEVVRAGIGTEKRWPLAGALVLVLIIPLLLPPRFSLGPRWVVPAIDAVLLVAILIADRGRSDRMPAAVRALSLALVVVLVAEAAGVAVRLITDLVKGGPETNNAADLLVTGASAGIGRACAEVLYQAGWAVTGASRRGTAPVGGRGWSWTSTTTPRCAPG